MKKPADAQPRELTPLQAMEQERDRHEKRASDETNRRYAAEEETKQIRVQFVDLKERLLNAEIELARLRGYLQRVHEDDIVRDGLVEIEDQQGKRTVPRRPAQGQYNSPVSEMQGYTGEPEKRTHWTSY